ncbi:hypothetical protein I3843_08G030500 [Carya illinoinensis]|nr:hypothetical protein I3843_08G030500 [Carya illinoinensis]
MTSSFAPPPLRDHLHYVTNSSPRPLPGKIKVQVLVKLQVQQPRAE